MLERIRAREAKSLGKSGMERGSPGRGLPVEKLRLAELRTAAGAAALLPGRERYCRPIPAKQRLLFSSLRLPAACRGFAASCHRVSLFPQCLCHGQDSSNGDPAARRSIPHCRLPFFGHPRELRAEEPGRLGIDPEQEYWKNPRGGAARFRKLALEPLRRIAQGRLPGSWPRARQ